MSQRPVGSGGASVRYTARNRHHRPQIAGHFNSDHAQFVSGDVVFDHEVRHVAEAKPGTQERMSRAHIGEPPGVFREYAVALACQIGIVGSLPGLPETIHSQLLLDLPLVTVVAPPTLQLCATSP